MSALPTECVLDGLSSSETKSRWPLQIDLRGDFSHAVNAGPHLMFGLPLERLRLALCFRILYADLPRVRRRALRCVLMTGVIAPFTKITGSHSTAVCCRWPSVWHVRPYHRLRFIQTNHEAPSALATSGQMGKEQ